MPGRLILPALAVLAAAAGPGQARIWTSSGGATVEAEFLRVEDGDLVVLQRQDGTLLGIQADQLSEADQAFLRDRDAPPTPRDLDPAPDSLPDVRYTPPHPALAETTFPPDESSPTDHATYWGFQYGPASNHVLYFAFEFPEPEQPPTRMLVYGPGHPDFAETTGFAARRDDYRGGRIHVFRGIRAEANHGEWTIRHDIEFRYGITRYEVVMAVIESSLRQDRRTYRFTRGGYITDAVSSGSGPIPVLPALQTVRFRSGAQVYRGRPLVEPDLRMGEFALLPGSNMDDEVRVEVYDTETDRRVERLQVPLLEESLTETGASAHRTYFELKSGRTYEVRAGLDLGPLLGTHQHTVSLSMPEPD